MQKRQEHTMRKSIFALAIGGLIASATFGAATPASAEHRTTIVRDGQRVVVVQKHKPMKKVFIRSDEPRRVVIHKSPKPRKVVVIRSDGSRVIRYNQPRRTNQIAIIRRD
jgi:hypothetical protein